MLHINCTNITISQIMARQEYFICKANKAVSQIMPSVHNTGAIYLQNKSVAM
jgi:hypothetical protein